MDEKLRIEKLRIENFRSIKQATLNLYHIMILSGINSCGKSSLLKSILLQQQIAEEMRSVNDVIPLNGKYVQLGSFDDVVTRGYDTITIGRTLPAWNKLGSDYYYDVTFSLVKGEDGNAVISEYILKLMNVTNSGEDIPTIIFKNRKVDYEKNIRTKYSVELHNWEKYLSVFNPHQVDINTITPYLTDAYGFFLERTQWDLIGFKAVEYKDYECWEDKQSPETPRNIGNEKEASINDINYGNYIIADVYRRIIERCTSDFSDYLIGNCYIGPFRTRNFEGIRINDIDKSVGIDGEYAKIALKRFAKNDVECGFKDAPGLNEFIVNDPIDIPEEYFDECGSRLVPLQEALDNCCDIFEIGRIHLENNTLLSGKDKIEDVGFGVSQIFPIVLQTLLLDITYPSEIPGESTLIIEQPEVHLHPALQMKLADLFICQSFGTKGLSKFIIETHSDHFINRIVRRIVETKNTNRIFNNLCDYIGIYFAEPDANGYAMFKHIVVDDNKGIVDWPKGFFDQGMDESEKTFEAIYKNINRK